MIAIAISATGLHLTTAGGVTLAAKIRATCEQLGIDGTGLSVSAALKACNKEMGIDPSGPIVAQTDYLTAQLGINFDATAPPPIEEAGTRNATAVDDDEPRTSLSVHAVMSAPAMVHSFSHQVCGRCAA